MRVETLRTAGAAALLLLACGGRAADSQTGRVEATRFPGTMIGMQYETWFTPGNAGSFETAEAIPVLGKYSSFDVKVLRKHAEWFGELGIDWLLLDWSNMLWAEPSCSACCARGCRWWWR